MTITVHIRGSLHRKDIRLLNVQANKYFKSNTLVFNKASKQIDSGFISLSADIIAAAAAILYCFIEGYRLFMKRQFTYNDLIEVLRNIMAEKGIIDVELVDIANFCAMSKRKFDEPCVVTLKNKKNNSFYKIFFFGKKNAYTIEITQV